MAGIDLVLQTNPYNCGSACLAMLLGLGSVEAAERRIGRKVGDLRDPEVDGDEGVIGLTAFEAHAILYDHHIPTLYVAVPTSDKSHPNATWFDRTGHALPSLRGMRRIEDHLDSGGRAMLGVTSRTRESGEHWIVADGLDLFDPTPNRDMAYTSLKRDAIVVYEALLVMRSNGD